MTIEMFDPGELGFGSPPQTAKRNRDREGAISSEESWRKHALLEQAIAGQIMAVAARRPFEPIPVIDGNAGDGHGVLRPQLDWISPNTSPTTPSIISILKRKAPNIEPLLCEIDKSRRAELLRRYPDIPCIRNNGEAPSHVKPGRRFGVWSSDPIGPQGHGIDAMVRFSQIVPAADFVVVCNEGAINRIASTKSDLWRTSRERYVPMLSPDWWMARLGRRRMARTPLIKASPNFHYRVYVIANYLSNAATRRPFEVIR